MINEFIRVIGMAPVVFGRSELVTAVQGAGLNRDMLINLMLAVHKAIADVFFPRAKRMAADLDIEWPTKFEETTRAQLQANLGLTWG